MSERETGVLLTGASSGFGELIARTLAGAGYAVFASMRDVEGRNREAAEGLRTWAAEHGVALQPVELDVTDEASVRACVQRVVEAHGRIDVVINNAGIAAAGPLEAFSVEQAQALFDTNVFGPLRVNRAALPHMRAQGAGLLVHVTSTLGRVLPFGGGLYPTSKWALEGLAESFSYDVAPFGIDVAIVEPGRFPTPAVGRAMRAVNEAIAEEYAAVRERRPDRDDPADPQEVADAILDLVRRPAGERPLRTVVGPVFTDGVTEYNAAYEVARERLARSLGRIEA